MERISGERISAFELDYDSPFFFPSLSNVKVTELKKDKKQHDWKKWPWKCRRQISHGHFPHPTLFFSLHVRRTKTASLGRLLNGQTETQVVASWKLASTCVSVWPGLRALTLMTCNDMRSLWSRSNLRASQCKFFLPFRLPNASQRKSCCLLQVL